MVGILSTGKGHYTFTDDETEADIAVVNTCAFIDKAKEESIENILDLAQRKKDGQLKALVVTGCMAQRYHDKILQDMPEVDAVLGTTAENHLGEVLDAILAGKAYDPAILEDIDATPDVSKVRILGTNPHVGYLKIAEGCDKRCTYCAIPDMRGHYRSVPMEDIMEQARTLVEQGATELILVAQETTLYGTDLYGHKALPELLQRLSLYKAVRWIRILYCYPEEITKELVDAMASLPKVLPYIDMPIQHASDRILRRMGRRTNRRDIEAKVRMLRAAMPDICIRTTLITGFPGETEAEHEQLLRFVRRMRFDRLGVYTYSKEEGTPAAGFEHQVHPSTKRRRQKELMLAQQEVAFKAAQRMKGKVLTCVIEGRLVNETGEHGGDIYVGRTYKDIPDVDNSIYIETRRDLMTGDYVDVRVVGANEYDLLGVLADA